MIKRHKILKEDRKTPFAIKDFVVGERVTLYGKTIHIVDADGYTRRHLEQKLGLALAPAEDYPDTPFQKVQAWAAKTNRTGGAPQPWLWTACVTRVCLGYPAVVQASRACRMACS